MSETMTLSDYLGTHPDYRTVRESPRQACRLQLDPDTGATVSTPVRITDDYVTTLERVTPDGFLVVTAGTHTIGMQAPYFSVTGTLWTSARGCSNGAGRYVEASGCIHDRIVRAFPRLASLVALHLADAITGIPLHDVENGWYWYEKDVDAVARLFRMGTAEIPSEMGKDQFRAFAYDQRDRWQTEAEAGRALILDLAHETERRQNA